MTLKPSGGEYGGVLHCVHQADAQGSRMRLKLVAGSEAGGRDVCQWENGGLGVACAHAFECLCLCVKSQNRTSGFFLGAL